MNDFVTTDKYVFHLEQPAYHMPANVSDDYKRGVCNTLSIMGHLKSPERFNVVVMFKEGQVQIDCQPYEQDLRKTP